MEQPAFGITILVDKPQTWTSFDVVNKLRYAARAATGRKKIKVGHAGTLDPLATGLLIVCVGAHTKTIEALTGMSKRYTGSIRLGGTTPSYDLETEVDESFPIPPFNASSLKDCARSFEGLISQLPPKYSAKKIDGRKAYELARKGKDVEMKPSFVTIDSFEIDPKEYPEIEFDLKCSKGTYVRSLAYDFGMAMGSGAHLTKLVRTEIGPYSLEDAMSIEEAIKHIDAEYIKYLETSVI